MIYFAASVIEEATSQRMGIVFAVKRKGSQDQYVKHLRRSWVSEDLEWSKEFPTLSDATQAAEAVSELPIVVILDVLGGGSLEPEYDPEHPWLERDEIYDGSVDQEWSEYDKEI